MLLIEILAVTFSVLTISFIPFFDNWFFSKYFKFSPVGEATIKAEDQVNTGGDMVKKGLENSSLETWSDKPKAREVINPSAVENWGVTSFNITSKSAELIKSLREKQMTDTDYDELAKQSGAEKKSS